MELPAEPEADKHGVSLGPVTLMAMKELTEAGRFETTLGQMCMTLANRLDHPGLDTGSALSAVAARLEAMMAAATKGAKASATQQLRDELAERRQKHA